MSLPMQSELEKMVVGLALQIVLDIDGKIKEVIAACHKYGVEPDYWAEVVCDESGEIRSECLNQKPIPPFELYDENGEFLDGKFWTREGAEMMANWLDANGKYSFIEIQNFAGNTCDSIGFNEEFDDDN